MSSSAIPPAPPPLPAKSAAAANAVLTMVAGKEAEALAKLPMGSVISVTVLALASKALVQVATAAGASLDLKLPPNLQLPPDADLTLQLVQQGGLPALKLLAVNGRPFGGGAVLAGGVPGGGVLSLPGAADPLAPGAPAMGRGAAVTLAGDQTAPAGQTAAGPLSGGALGLTATVVRPAVAGAVMIPQGVAAGGQLAGPLTPPPGFADLPPGTQLTVRIAAIAPPGGAPVPPLAVGDPALARTAMQPQNPAQVQGAASPQNPIAAQNPAQAQPAIAGSSTPAAAPALPPGAVPAPMPAAAPQMPPVASQPAAAPSNVALAGNVIAHSPGGTSLVQTPAGLLSLAAGPTLPVGGTVQLEVVGQPAPPPPASPAGQQASQGLGPNGWPTLSAAADVLALADRQAADQLIRMIPQANPRLAAALSSFAGAVRSGDFKLLGGDNVIKGLDKAGRRDLADRLKRDFLELAEEAQRPRGDGDWQVVTLPFAHGADIDPIALYVHRPGPEEEGKPGQEQRFILDVRMSRLGRIQFDGLVSRESKRFDLIVRSAEPLGAEICRDIAGIFAECGQLTGIKGTVGFQSGRSFMELPPADAKGTRIVV